jgi:uncharacterized SAM-binding protein YcdF (DUF218 family)
MQWEEIVLGTPHGNIIPTLEGRAVMGLLQAVNFKADHIIFGSGASSKDGLSEARYTQQSTLAYLPQIKNALILSEEECTRLRYLVESAVIEETSKSTREEIRYALEFCATECIDRMVLVSSAWHIERCHAEALEAVHSLRSHVPLFHFLK